MEAYFIGNFCDSSCFDINLLHLLNVTVMTVQHIYISHRGLVDLIFTIVHDLKNKEARIHAILCPEMAKQHMY